MFMIVQVIGLTFCLFVLFLIYLRSKVDKQKYNSKDYYQLSIMLGSGGHTGELCQMIGNFNILKINKLNVLVGNNDKTSQFFFKNTIKSKHSKEFERIMTFTQFHYLYRTNQVKQSYLKAIFTGLRSLIYSFKIVVSRLINTTHFIGNGPGTCVPLYYIFFILKKFKISKTKLIFIQSWCRVDDLSLTGKLVKPIINDFIVHWPQLQLKYPKNCKYYGQII